MKTTKKSFVTPASKPGDVEYRLKRLNETLLEASMFLNAIDPAALGEKWNEVRTTLNLAITQANGLEAPARKPRGKKTEEASVDH